MLLFDDGLRRMTVRYLEERDDNFNYRRRYPTRLRKFFDDKTCRFESLHTKSKPEAVRKLALLVARDKAEWAHLETGEFASSDMTKIAEGKLARMVGMKPGDGAKIQREAERTNPTRRRLFMERGERDEGPFDPLEHYLSENYNPGDAPSPIDDEMCRLAYGETLPKRLSDALELYLSEHSKGREPRFAREMTNAIDLVKACVGDLPLTAYKSEYARTVREAIIKRRVATATVRRQIERISAVHTKGLRGFDLPFDRFPLRGVSIANEGVDKKPRLPFTDADLVTLAAAIRSHDDDMRHILRLQFNTGARLKELVGMRVSDVVLDGPIPHIIITPFAERSLKNKNSIRKVPLVGLSLWSATRALGSGAIKFS
jgi:hypothetical protein